MYIIDDSTVEIDQYFHLELTTNSAMNAKVDSDTSTVTIIDDDGKFMCVLYHRVTLYCSSYIALFPVLHACVLLQVVIEQRNEPGKVE